MMKVQKIGSRGYVFTFEDPYKLNIYAILGDENTFICDTGFGSDSVNQILEYLKKENIPTTSFVVFNSHADYDHVWGNHMFKDSDIIAHELSPTIFEKEGEEILEKYKNHKRGEVILTPPNKLFKEKMILDNENIEFYHTPGHTLESSSCFDHRDQILFVGDNIESPIPYINFLNLKDYTKSLEEYLQRNAKIIVSGHDDIMYNDELIKNNLEYLKKLQIERIDTSDFSKQKLRIHFGNVSLLAEKYKEEGNKECSLRYYEESLEILKNVESTKEIEAKIAEFKENIKELK